MYATNTSIAPVQALALSKLSLPAKVRDQIEPDDYPLDFRVHIFGNVGVGASYKQAVSTKVPWRDMLGAALSQMSPAHRLAFVRNFLDNSDDGPAKVKSEAVSEEVEGMVRAIVATTATTCRGKTTANLAVEVLV